jgi:uncharacterized membrane protein YraQ (UPF0718 family)
MIYLAGITLVLLIVSLIKDRKKTFQALRIALKKFTGIGIALLLIVVLVSLLLYFVPEQTISKYLGNNNKIIGVSIASVIGSITIMPGFIAFPLSGILKQSGVPYMIISAFTTTLMMVGIITFPVERKYFGTKVAILRNVISFIIAIGVSFITGLLFREIF